MTTGNISQCVPNDGDEYHILQVLCIGLPWRLQAGVVISQINLVFMILGLMLLANVITSVWYSVLIYVHDV